MKNGYSSPLRAWAVRISPPLHRTHCHKVSRTYHTLPEDKLLLRFTAIDPSNREREFSIVVDTSETTYRGTFHNPIHYSSLLVHSNCSYSTCINSTYTDLPLKWQLIPTCFPGPDSNTRSTLEEKPVRSCPSVLYAPTIYSTSTPYTSQLTTSVSNNVCAAGLGHHLYSLTETITQLAELP